MSIPSLQHRSTSPADSTSMSSTTLNLLIALLVLLFVALLCVGALYFTRRVRRSRAIARQSLPQYNDNPSSYNKRLTINVYDEKASILSNPSSPPQSPSSVPEIRITFPDEQDETTGRRKSGRVLVVRVGEKGIGLEPMSEDEQLPAYQKDGGRESFQDVDMERIGGLKEKKDIYS